MIRRSLFSHGIAEVIGRICSFLTFPLLARFAGADGLGAYGQVTTIVGFIIPLGSLGMGGAILRFFSEKASGQNLKRDLGRILFWVISLAAFPAMGIWHASDFLNRTFLNYTYGPEMFQWGAVLIVVGSIEHIVLNFCRARLFLFRSAGYNLIQSLSLLACASALLPRGYNVLDLIQLSTTFKVLSLGALTFSLFRIQGSGPEVPSHPIPIRRMIAYGMSATITGLGLWLMNLGDRLVIGHFLTASHLGHYSGVYALAMIMAGVNAPLNHPLYPLIIDSVRSKDKRKLGSVIETYHSFQVLLLTLIAIPLLTQIEPILVVFGGTSFHVGLMVGVWIVLAVFVDQINAIAHYVLLANDRQILTQNIWIGAGIANIIGNIVLTPSFGLNGAAAVTFCCFAVVQIIVFYKACSYFPLYRHYRWGKLLKTVIACSISTGVSQELVPLLKLTDIVQFGILYVSITTVLLIAFGVLSPKTLISQLKKSR